MLNMKSEHLRNRNWGDSEERGARNR